MALASAAILQRQRETHLDSTPAFTSIEELVAGPQQGDNDTEGGLEHLRIGFPIFSLDPILG